MVVIITTIGRSEEELVDWFTHAPTIYKVLLSVQALLSLMAVLYYLKRVRQRRKDQNDSCEPYVPESANEARAVNDALKTL